jgi:hypothetical protein
VTYFDRAYFVRGFSPMSAARRSIQLENAETGMRITVWADDLTGAFQASSGAADQTPATGESESD